ncbi:hypothetical protein [Streptomyces morookaense]|uniref:hypothetical protein n=1 Tax=Streptomyces morookaense TaxID=1970 RepID=UPI0019A9FD7F|nr:hypothetical protein [Streptomyces morookaense]GHF55447.1 hypothetical protein GCM10010359_67140 [Streptomyces morookaense]
MSSGGSAEQQLQLDQANTGGVGGGQGTLASSASDKQHAVTFMQQHLLPDTQAAARMGEGGGRVQPPLAGSGALQSSLLKPDTGLHGLSAWATAAGLSEATSLWQGQANRLMDRLHRELDALHSTNTLFQGQDAAIGAQFNSTGGATQEPFSSRLDRY